VHLVGFITKKFVTMHGHTNIKWSCSSCTKIMVFWGCHAM